MRGDFDEDEYDDAPLMWAFCEACTEFRGVCCGNERDGYWCVDCCDHPYEDADPGDEPKGK
jgi:hypothetical protein